MNKNENSENDSQLIDSLPFNWWAMTRAMNGVLSVDDYDELRDF